MCAVWNEISDSNAVRCVIRPKYTSSVNVWQQILIKFFFVVARRNKMAARRARRCREAVENRWNMKNALFAALYAHAIHELRSGKPKRSTKISKPVSLFFFFYNNKFRWVNSFNFIKYADLWVPHIFTHIRMRTGRAGNWNSFVAMEIIAVLLFLIKKHTPAAHVICVRRTSMHGANRKNLNASHM